MPDESQLKLGISTCLLGEQVRYDGGHKLDHYLKDVLGKYVTWIPVCPEVECGLSIPREPMHLEGTPDNPLLIATKSRKDLTNQMLSFCAHKLDNLEKEDLCGFIFKTKSPSSGMRQVKYFNEKGSEVTKGPGIFAGLFMKRFPLLPVEDEGRLHDEEIRENFIERIFAMKRWKDTAGNGASISSLLELHTCSKLQLMSHSPEKLKRLGHLLAQGRPKKKEVLFSKYLEGLMDILKLKATVKKNVNVMHHIMVYFKKQISQDEKKELHKVIEDYHQGFIPLIAPIILLAHYIKKYKNPYLLKQTYLHPHPIELKLRNHA